MTVKEVKQTIENRVRQRLIEAILNERDVIKIPSPAPEVPMDDPNAMGGDNTAMPADPNMDPNAAPPADGGMGEMSQSEDPNLTALMDLLQQNPDRVEGVYKYAKGIIGNDVAPAEDGEESAGGEIPGVQEEPGAQGAMPESRQVKLDELVDDILNIKDKKIKPTLSKPIGKTNTMKGQMFRPVMGF